MTVYHLGHLQNSKLIDADMYKKYMMLVPETRKVKFQKTKFLFIFVDNING